MKVISRHQAIAAGLDRYFTGKPCRCGHVEERRTKTRNCLGCIKVARDKKREKMRVYRSEHREELREYYRQYRAKNPQVILEIQKRYAAKGRPKRKRDPEKANERQRRYWLSNKEAFADRARQQRVAKPDQYRAYVHRRRARLRSAGGRFGADDVANLRVMQGNKCARCFVSLSKIKMHIDHIMPLSLGGSNDKTNIQLLCAPCNLSKQARDPVVDARMLGRLL